MVAHDRNDITDKNIDLPQVGPLRARPGQLLYLVLWQQRLQTLSQTHIQAKPMNVQTTNRTDSAEILRPLLETVTTANDGKDSESQDAGDIDNVRGTAENDTQR